METLEHMLDYVTVAQLRHHHLGYEQLIDVMLTLQEDNGVLQKLKHQLGLKY